MILGSETSLADVDGVCSLGWELALWMEEYLRVPSGPLYGEPFRLTEEQLVFLVMMYELDPETGRRVFRRFVKRGPKGCGKSPFAGAWLLAEFCGPVVFDGFDAHGDPVGRRWPFPMCHVIGTAEEQTDNLWLATREMAAGSLLVDEMGVTLGFGKISFDTGEPGIMEPVSSSASAREGAPVTAAALEETHLWFGKAGGYQRLAAVTRRNVGKTGGTTFEVTNAPALGQGSVAEQTVKAVKAGKLQAGVLYQSREGTDVDSPKDSENRDALMDSLREAYGEASTERGGWVDLERIYEECLDEETTEMDIRRFYLNLAVHDEARAFNMDQFDVVADTERTVEADTPVLLAFDGAWTTDSTVLSAWTLGEFVRTNPDDPDDLEETMVERPHHFMVRAWERPVDLRGEQNYEHPRNEYRDAVNEAIERYDVVMLAYDSSFTDLSALYDEWLDRFGEAGKKLEDDWGRDGIVLGYPTASAPRMDPAIKRILGDMRDGLFTHDDDPIIRRHVRNATLHRKGEYRRLAKPSGVGERIDGAVTMTFGYHLLPIARRLFADRKPKWTGPLVAVK